MGKTKKRRVARAKGRVRRRGEAPAAGAPQELQMQVGAGAGVVRINLSKRVQNINLTVQQAFEMAQALMQGAASANEKAQQQAAGLVRNEAGVVVGPDGAPVVSRPTPREPRASA